MAAKNTKNTDTATENAEANNEQVIVNAEIPTFEKTNNVETLLKFFNDNHIGSPKTMQFDGFTQGEHKFTVIEKGNFIDAEIWNDKKDGSLKGRPVVLTNSGSIPCKPEIAKQLTNGMTIKVFLKERTIKYDANKHQTPFEDFPILIPSLMDIVKVDSAEVVK